MEKRTRKNDLKMIIVEGRLYLAFLLKRLELSSLSALVSKTSVSTIHHNKGYYSYHKIRKYIKFKRILLRPH
jgi:hypothetical protein